MNIFIQIFDSVIDAVVKAGFNPIIALVNLVGAIIVIIQAIKKPQAKFFAVVGLLCGIASVATAEYTILSIILLIALGIIIFLINSIQVYSDFEKHVVQASILFGEASKIGGTSKKELEKLLKSVRKKLGFLTERN